MNIVTVVAVILFTMFNTALCKVNTESEVNEIIDVLNRGDQTIKASKQNDIIYVLGPTGTGKSTFAHLVAGDPSFLRSIEIEKDSDDFIIEHVSGDKIGNVTVESKTIYPDLIIDENDVPFYDCPGLSDTRNTSIEFANTYFTRKVISYAKRLKIVFVVNYHSMLKGISSRIDFLQFVKHATELLKNVELYGDGMILVVSKVPVHSEPKSDQRAIRKITSFLREYQTALNDELKRNPVSNPEKLKALNLINIFLIKNRIGLFKRPRHVGLLSEIPEVMQNRAELLNLINEKIKFVKKNDEDFGYTLSDRSKLKIIALTEEINRKITKLFEQINQRVTDFYSNRPVDYDNMEDSYSEFDNAIKILSKFSSGNMSTSEYVTEVNQLFIPNLQENLKDVRNHIDYLRFLQKVHDKTIVRPTSDWTRPLEKCLEYLRAQRNWCLFAENLFNRLSDFNVQKNVSKFDVANVELWGKGDIKRDAGIVINHENFGIFLRMQVDFELVKNANATEPKIDLLNYILKTTVKSKLTTTCQKDMMTVRGNFVKLSDLQTISCGDNVRSIQIFALYTIFLDTDFKRNVDLVIIAPKWYVRETHTRISLDGVDGESYSANAFEFGSELEAESMNGKSGMAGQDANHFFGYGDVFVNSQNLHISAVGGDGGRGQNGYNSHDVEIKTPIEGSSEEYFSKISKSELIGTSSDEEIGFLFFNQKYWLGETFQFYASCPRENGLGGLGGLGGHGGTIELNGISDIKIETKNGKYGSNGAPGKCGKVAETIEMQKSTLRSCTFWILCHKKVNWTGIKKFINTKCGKSCRNPIHVNETRIQPLVSNKRQNSAISINQFKSFVRENLFASSMNQKRAAIIVGSIEQNSMIKATYDTAAFIDDFLQIEKQFYLFKDENYFLHLYQSLLQRVLEYVLNRNGNELDVNERRILANLCAAGLSKICKIRSGTGQYLIIDIKSYLNVAIDHIRKMKKTGKLAAINQLKNEYRQSLERKMNESHAFIVMDIVPEIEKLNYQIDSEIENLLDEVLKAKLTAITDIDQHNRVVKKLQRSVDLRGIFKFIKFVTGIASYFDIFSTVVAGTINNAVQIANTFTLDNEKQMPSKKISFTPSTELKDYYSQVGNSSEQKSGFILSILNEILTMAAHFSFDDVLEQATKVKNILSGDKRVDLSSQEIDLLQDNVRDIMQKTTDEVKAKNESHSLNALEEINKQLSLLAMDSDLFSKFRTNDHKLYEIEATMRHSQHRLKKLKNFERIYLQLVDPMAKHLHQLFNRIPLNFIDQPTSELITKWHIQSTLKDLRFQMQQIGNELEFKRDVLHVIDKLDGAFTTLISIYDQTQIYEEQVKLSAYIASIESTDSSHEMNSLDMDLEKLNVIIQSNVVLTIFDKAVNGFKQTIFPFADFYLRRFNLPPQLAVNKTLEMLVNDAADELENLKLTLEEYNSASINDNDNIIHTADFTSNFITSQPFYVWTTNNHNEVISQLLSGKAITVKADITKDLKLNAVKFQYLEIHLRTRNQTNQAKLDEILEHYDVTIVHHGNSYYRCDKKFYLIASQSQRIEYSFEKDTNGFPIRRNNVYHKMRNGDFTLSPYALLTISIASRKSLKLTLLYDEFGGTVDLELIGRGQYVNPDVDACLGLEKYYTADELVGNLSDKSQFD